MLLWSADQWCRFLLNIRGMGLNGPDHIRAFVGGQGGEPILCSYKWLPPILEFKKSNVWKSRVDSPSLWKVVFLIIPETSTQNVYDFVCCKCDQSFPPWINKLFSGASSVVVLDCSFTPDVTVWADKDHLELYDDDEDHEPHEDEDYNSDEEIDKL